VTRVLVTGGAGYVGSALVPRLIEAGHEVTVVDLYLYGDDVLDQVSGDPRLREVKGDIRDEDLLEREVADCDAVIHLACISNDPSFELDPELGRSINFDAFGPLVRIAKNSGVGRFVYASSSSVYGVKDVPNVTEDMELEPLTDYSRYKALCEEVLLAERSPGFVPLVLRPATVCGWAPRLRLDLTVNILTNHGYHNRVVKVFGGAQLRPNIHVDDMVDLYLLSLALPDAEIDGKVLNAGYENHAVAEIAEIVRRVLGPDVEVEATPTDDMRSYHISSARIRQELGFVPKRTVADAVRSLVEAFDAGRVPGALDDPRYYNVRRMQDLALR
jgi:nucleoside-diphosphate-sugar epimerase